MFVHSRTSSLQVGFGPRAEMRDDFGRGERAGFEAAPRAARPRQRAARKPAANRSPAPVVSTTLATGAAATSTRSPPSIASAPAAPRVTTSVATLATARRCVVEIVAAGQVPDLVLVAEQDVDRARLDHAHHAFAAAGDAQAFGQSEGDRASGRVGDLGRPQHRRARPLGAPQIAFEEGDRGRADQLLVERLGRQLVARAGQVFIVRWASGVTRIRQRPVGGAAGQRRRFEAHAERRHVVRENLAELVVGDLADEAGAAARARRAPAMLFAADPPLISRAGPIAA